MVVQTSLNLMVIGGKSNTRRVKTSTKRWRDREDALGISKDKKKDRKKQRKGEEKEDGDGQVWL